MKLPITLANWIADSEASHGQSFEDWAPDGFDWRAFCADAPAFAERLGDRFPAATAPAARARLEELATAAFRGAYVATLCVFSAYDAEADPDDALARLAQPLTADEIGPFTDAVASDLDAVEAALGANPDDEEEDDEDAYEDDDEGEPAEEDTAGDSPAGSAAAQRVIALARSAREVVRQTLAPGLRGAAKALVSLGARSETTSRILSGVVNVAIAVAAFRYVAASEAAVAAGGDPPAYDPDLLAAATGRAPQE